jgi:uncharacterized SAM-dependent methyltransferase
VSARFRELFVDASVRSEAVAQRRDASLRSGSIDHFFHYHGLEQTRRWLGVHRAHAPRFAQPDLDRPYHELAAKVAALAPGSDVVAFGPGAGSKERMVLAALGAQGGRPRYLPVDASVELALLSADAAQGVAAAPIVPLVGELELAPDLPDWLDRRWGERARIVTAFGIAPNLLPSRFFPLLAAVLRPHDWLLVSANLAPLAAGAPDDAAAYRAACAGVAAQYDNPETLYWLSCILEEWGLAALLEPVSFRIEPLEEIDAFVAATRWRSDTDLRWEGRPFAARAGGELRLFYSLRYTVRRFEAQLQRCGLGVEQRAIDPTGQEGVWIARRTAPVEHRPAHRVGKPA